jgi:hypothetical protein
VLIALHAEGEVEIFWFDPIIGIELPPIRIMSDIESSPKAEPCGRRFHFLHPDNPNPKQC